MLGKTDWIKEPPLRTQRDKMLKLCTLHEAVRFEHRLRMPTVSPTCPTGMKQWQWKKTHGERVSTTALQTGSISEQCPPDSQHGGPNPLSYLAGNAIGSWWFMEKSIVLRERKWSDEHPLWSWLRFFLNVMLASCRWFILVFYISMRSFRIGWVCGQDQQTQGTWLCKFSCWVAWQETRKKAVSNAKVLSTPGTTSWTTYGLRFTIPARRPR